MIARKRIAYGVAALLALVAAFSGGRACSEPAQPQIMRFGGGPGFAAGPAGVIARIVNNGATSYSGIQTDTTSTGTVTGYALGANTTVLRLQPSSALAIAGITAPTTNRWLFVCNTSTTPSAHVTLSHNNGTETVAANRILGEGGTANSGMNDVTIAAGSVNTNNCATLWYDLTTARWRVINHSGVSWNNAALFSGGFTANGAANFNNAANFAHAVSLTAEQSDTSTGTTTLAVASSAFSIRWTGASNVTWTNWSGSNSGRAVLFKNASASSTATFKHNNAAAAGDFSDPYTVDLVCPPGTQSWIVYDSTATRWRPVGGVGCYSQASNTLAANPAGVMTPTSYYYPIPSATIATSATAGNNNLYASAGYIPNTVTVNRLFAEVTTIGEAGSKVRLCVYGDDGTMRPSNLIVDAGQIAGDSATVQELTPGSPPSIGPGWYWWAFAVQSAPTTQPTLRVNTSSISYGTTTPFSSLPGAGNVPVSVKHNGVVSGACPSTFSPLMNQSFSLRMGLRT